MADEPAYLWEIDGCTFPVPVPLKAWLGVYKIAEYNATLLSLNWPSGNRINFVVLFIDVKTCRKLNII